MIGPWRPMSQYATSQVSEHVTNDCGSSTMRLREEVRHRAVRVRRVLAEEDAALERELEEQRLRQLNIAPMAICVIAP